MTEYSQTGTGDSLDMSGSYNHVGQKFEASHELIGQAVSKVQFKLKKLAADITDTTISCAWYDSDNVLQSQSSTTYNTVTDLTTTFAYKEFPFSYTVSDGDFCAVTTSVNIGTSKMSVEGGSNAYADTETWIQSGGVWQARTSDRNLIITYGSPPSAGGTRLPPPPLIARF